MVNVDDLKGKSIRGYQLRDLIGVGGFGVVYRAYQSVIEREVAIKIILPNYANKASFVRNFEREAQLVARLEHPHIVPLYDYWRDPSGAYIVMRWLRGGSLQESLRKKGNWELQPTALLLEQIASALAEAHRNSVVHQDIKAGNILLDEQGNAYLTDFGIAKDLNRAKDEVDDLQENGEKQEVHGSPEYMAPEQILNLPVDARTDIYSLGVVLYEILTGEKPFEAPNDEELVRKQLYERVPLLQLKRPDLPSTLDIVIQRATDKNPKKRYPNPIAMAENFREFVNIALNPQPISIEAPLPVAVIEAKPVLDPVNPYKGLRAFQEADAADFFGREKLIERLYRRMLEPDAEARFLAVVGPSGSGKSSVVRAGLLPMIRQNLPRWFITYMTPAGKPIAQLVEAVLKVAMDDKYPYESVIQSSVDGLHQAISQALGAGKTQLVLVIDQFEELFTQVASEAERKHFIDSLLAAIAKDDSRLRVVVTLRADFYDRPLAYSGLSELINHRTEVVSPLTPEELERVIVKPAERVGLKLEDGLVGEIVGEVASQAGALPLLQFALMELFDQRENKQAMITLRAYRVNGGAAGAMTRRADEIFNALPEDHKTIAEQFFLRLVTLGEGAEDTRRRVLRSELSEMNVDQARLSRVIDAFGQHRLLSFDRDMTSRIPTVEIAHEALIRRWQVLRKWLDNNREALRLQRQLAEAAEQWQNAKTDRSFLAGGSRLAQLERVLETPTIVLRPNEQEFLNASVQQRVRNAQRLRAFISGLIVFSIFTALLAVFALDQRGRAERARDEAERNRQIAVSRQLAIAALTDNSTLDRALLLSVEAYETFDTSAARDALLTKTQAVPRLERFLHGNTEGVRAVAYSPDGRLIATGGNDNTVRLWNAETGAPFGEVARHNDDVYTVAFSPDSTQFASASEDGILRIWDVSSGAMITEVVVEENIALWRLDYSPDGTTIAVALNDGTIRLVDVATGIQRSEPLVGHRGGVYTVAYSPDGRLIASGGIDNTVRLWDAQTGEPVGDPLEGHTNWVWTVAFSPDSTLLASGGFDNTIRLWDVETGQETGEPLTAHTAIVRAVQFDQRGRLMVSAGEDQQLIIWNLLSRTPLSTLRAEDKIRGASFSPDGGWLVSASDATSVQLWNLRRRSALSQIYIGQTQPIFGLKFEDSALVSISNNPNITATSQTIVRWSASDQPDNTIEIGASNTRLVLAVALEGQTVATADQTGQVIFFDLNTGQQSGAALQADSAAIYAIAFSGDGTKLATGNQVGEIKLWARSETGWQQTGQTLEGHLDRILSLAFSPDNQYLVSGGRDSIVRLWDVNTASAIGGDLIGHSQEVISLAFSPDGSYFVSGGRDHLLVFWDVASRSLRQTLRQHGNWVNSLAFSPDGRFLASGSRDQTAILWDVSEAAARQIGEPLQIGTSINSVSFSADSSRLALGGESGAVHIWQIGVEVWKETACAIANRNLTPEEWAAYFDRAPYQSTCG